MVYAPSTWKADKNCAKEPEQELVREHVYGIDGSKPGSVHLVAGGSQCVYIAAKLCVIEDLLKPQQRYFEGHNADVSCLNVAPKLDLAISGQQEPPGVGSSYACVWCPSYPSRALCKLHCYIDRSEPCKGGEVPRHRDRKEGEVDFPHWVDPTTVTEAQLRGISAVAISASGRFAVMMAMDEQRSIALFRLPTFCSKPVTAEPTQTYVVRIPEMLMRGSGNITEMAITNPFDSEERFRFATLSKTAVKLWEYCEVRKELAHRAVIFGKAPQQHLMHVGYATEAGHLLMCGKEGQLYDVHGSHVHHNACLAQQLCSAVSLQKQGQSNFDFLACDSNGTFLLGRFEEDPVPMPRQSRPLGIRPQVIERFTLEDLPAESGQEFPKGLQPRWKSLQANEKGQILAASLHILVVFDLGLQGGKRRLLRVVQVAHKVESWALAHHPTIPGLCVSGDERGVVHFWDLEAKKPLFNKTYRSDQTVHRLEFSPEGDILVLGQMGLVTLLEFPSLRSLLRRRVSFVKDFRGQEGEVISWIVFSNYADSDKSRYLACACWDQNIYLFRLIWKTRHGHKHKESERHREIHYRGALTGNSSSPTHVMFTADAQFLVSNSTDMSIIVWRTGTGERLSTISAVRDMPRLGPWRNVLGWPVAGIWKDSYAQSDINAVCQSFSTSGEASGNVVAVGDDDGMVNLYRFPAPVSRAKGREYSGHASHVTNVQFNSGNVLVTLGGGDHTLMQWRLKDAPIPLLRGGGTRPPLRELPWTTLPALPALASCDRDERAASGPTSAGSSRGSAASAEDMLQHLGRSGPPPRRRRALGSATAGYPGFKGPFEGDTPDLPVAVPVGVPTAPAARPPSVSSVPSSAPPQNRTQRSSSLPASQRPPVALHALHQPNLTPAAEHCRRLARRR